ncbi:MAG: ATP/GTP-binding protein [Promethearchaeota archaeon]
MKIVVTGALHSGKSSYVKYFDTKAMNIEAAGSDKKFYTVGMDLATFQIEAFKIFLFGTPGLLRMQIMRDVIADGADGVIFLLDSTRPESDEDAMLILHSLKEHIPPDIPIIFCANKQDEQSARSSEQVKAQNQLPDNAKIFPISVKNRLNMNESLKYIVNLVFEKYEDILEILRKYEDDLEGLGKQLNMNTEELQEYLRSLEIKRFITIDRENKTIEVIEGLKKLI